MTSLNIDIPTTGLHAIMSMSSFDEKFSLPKNLISYTIPTKISDRKPTFKLSFIDWDVNMNELEFE